MKKIILTLSIAFFITTNVFAAGSSSSGSSAKETAYDKAVLLVKSAKKYEKKGKSEKAKKVYAKAQKLLIKSNEKKPGKENLRVLENIDVALTVEVGGAEIKIKELLRLGEGSVVELDRLAGDPLDILANGTIIAKGEVVMVGERFGIRFTEVADPEERVQNL